uniref:Uncharacterized protein n=1 Tax=Rhipicephalus microplus TaxID=6941 RepID=A0A6G5A9A8_RHIMP
MEQDMGNGNINTVLALFLVVATCKTLEIEGLVGPPDSLPSKPEESDPPADTSPKEDATGPKAFLPLATIPGYDERCNVQVTTTKKNVEALTTERSSVKGGISIQQQESAYQAATKMPPSDTKFTATESVGLIGLATLKLQVFLVGFGLCILYSFIIARRRNVSKRMTVITTETSSLH